VAAGLGLDLPVGGRGCAILRLRAAFYRTPMRERSRKLLKAAGVEFGPHARAGCCGGTGGRDGYVDRHGAFAEHNVADWRAVGARTIIAADRTTTSSRSPRTTPPKERQSRRLNDF